MGFYRGPNIVRDNLILNLDAASLKSYPGSGDIWYDLSGNNINATLVNSPSHLSESFFRFETGSTQYGHFTITSSLIQFESSSITYEICFREPFGGINHNKQDILFGNKRYNTNGDGLALSHASSPNDVLAWNNLTVPTNGSSNRNSQKVVDCGADLDLDGSADDVIPFDWALVFITLDNSDLGAITQSVKVFSTSSLAGADATDNFSGFYTNLYNNGEIYGIACGPTSTATFTSFTSVDFAYIRIYNKILSEEEIQQNYNAFKNRFDI